MVRGPPNAVQKWASEWMLAAGASQCGGCDAGPHRGGALLPVWHGQLECICGSGHPVLASLLPSAVLLPDLEPMHACQNTRCVSCRWQTWDYCILMPDHQSWQTFLCTEANGNHDIWWFARHASKSCAADNHSRITCSRMLRGSERVQCLHSKPWLEASRQRVV